MEPSTNTVIYLSYDGLTDPLGQSQILPYLIGLSSKGYQFIIVSFEKEKAFGLLKDEIHHLCSQHQIIWKPLGYHKNPPVLSTLYDLWNLWLEVKKSINQYPVSIIHCRSYLTSIVGLSAKRKWGVKFIFDMRGFWADERVEGEIWNIKNPFYKIIYKYFKKKEKEFLREADHVISLTENAKQEILSWRHKTADITVIPTCVDLKLFNPSNLPGVEIQSLREELKISKDDFVLFYLGSWGTWYLKNEMLRFFALLRTQLNAKFLILSKDVIDLDGYQFAEDVIIREVNHTKVPLYITIASAAIAFIKPSFSKKASSATKIGELLAMDIITVTNNGWGDIDRLKYENILLLPDLSEDTMRLSIVKLLSLKAENSSGSIKTSPLSLGNGIINYQRVYERIA